MQKGDDVRVVVLAGGEGKRLANLTTRRDGVAVPKQYCSWIGEESLLHATLRRAQRIVPAKRLYVSVLEKHACYWREQLQELPADQIIRQPSNRGTGMGILLPLLQIFRRAPDATVVILPSDHHVEDETVFYAALSRAIAAARSSDNRPILLGVTPDRPEPEYGWVLPKEEREDDTLDIQAFAEKPTAPRARDLMSRGGMWSSLILIGKLTSLFRLYDRAAHLLLHVFLRSYQRNPDPGNLESLYDVTPPLDFSKDLLQACPELLRCLPLPPCGWSDLGSPARIHACLRQRIGERSRQYRADLGFSSTDLSQRSGLPLDVLEKYENGSLSLDPILTREIAASLGIAVEDLLGIREGKASALPSLSHALIDAANISYGSANVVPMRRTWNSQEALST